ncbi:hypothetical protein AVBRAN12642_09315 [Campylobacter sp. RM12642]|uniref:hypothetical protein n=1 Tax=Campylobacter sp. RM12642 TaxID=2735736 RepID=UPI0030146989|nr:hypothetical protein [Campylobacter sp. RM12642]
MIEKSIIKIVISIVILSICCFLFTIIFFVYDTFYMFLSITQAPYGSLLGSIFIIPLCFLTHIIYSKISKELCLIFLSIMFCFSYIPIWTLSIGGIIALILPFMYYYLLVMLYKKFFKSKSSFVGNTQLRVDFKTIQIDNEIYEKYKINEALAKYNIQDTIFNTKTILLNKELDCFFIDCDLNSNRIFWILKYKTDIIKILLVHKKRLSTDTAIFVIIDIEGNNLLSEEEVIYLLKEILDIYNQDKQVKYTLLDKKY